MTQQQAEMFWQEWMAFRKRWGIVATPTVCEGAGTYAEFSDLTEIDLWGDYPDEDKLKMGHTGYGKELPGVPIDPMPDIARRTALTEWGRSQ